MTKKVKIGILGCANIAERYSIKAFQIIPNAEVVSIASRDIEKARAWSKRFNIPTAESYDSLIKNNGIDAVYIPLPIGLHKEWTIKAAQVGKHIMSEKSLAPDLKSARKIIDTCRQNKVILYENFTCDYHPQHHRVVELIKNGSIGKPYIFQSLYGFPLINSGNNFRYDKDLGGSALNESGSYQIYTARKLIKREPLSVNSKLCIENGVDMNGSVVMDFGNNILAQVYFNLNAVYQNYYLVWGSKGLIRVGRAYAISPDFKPIVELVKNENRQEKVEKQNVPTYNHFEAIFYEFCDLVLNKVNKDKKVEEKYIDILNQAKTLEAIRISSKKNREVLLSEI